MRLDLYLVENNLSSTRSKAQMLIKEGLVFVDGKSVTKVSQDIGESQKVEVREHDEYVSRGAKKLLGAIDVFSLNFKDKVVLDMGASTGGFTQVALKFGAKKVYAVDVGKGQLDEKIKSDPRVKSMENQDVRLLTSEQVKNVDIVVGDLSFISLKLILPHLKQILGDKEMCLLFKPQFECGKEIAKKSRGVIKDAKIHKRLLEDFCDYVKVLGFNMSGLAVSPITGGDGNREFLVYLNGKEQNKIDIDKMIK